MTADHIRYAVDEDGIATLTIDRPDKRNAMTWAMLAEFNKRIAEAAEDQHVRVLIVTGTGGQFCAGTDLAGLAETPKDERGGQPGRELWPLWRCPKPVIGAIDGYAVGMGAELTTQCDVRIMTNRVRIAWNFALRGLVPDTGAGSWLLPRIIGPQRALRLLSSAAFLEAEEAKAIGYAAEVVEPEKLMETAMAEARRYLACSPFSQTRIKALVWEGLERDIAAHMEAHRKAIRECFHSEDHKEGIASFLEKRPAKFTGR